MKELILLLVFAPVIGFLVYFAFFRPSIKDDVYLEALSHDEWLTAAKVYIILCNQGKTPFQTTFEIEFDLGRLSRIGMIQTRKGLDGEVSYRK